MRRLRTTSPRRVGVSRAGLLAPPAAALAALVLIGCHSGTPAAPDGTRVLIGFEYVEGSRNISAGDFEAVVTARVIDDVSNVPQTGVGVFFRVESGPGQFIEADPIRTDGAGIARNVLVATGAVRTNPVTVHAFSGAATSPSLTVDVLQGFSSQAFPPVASFTMLPPNPTTSTTVTINVSGSSDPDCPGNVPVRWTVDWGDGSPEESRQFTDPQATHVYSTAGEYTIVVTVIDCQGLSATATRSVTVT